MQSTLPSMRDSASSLIVLRPSGLKVDREIEASVFGCIDDFLRQKDIDPSGFYLDGWQDSDLQDIVAKVRRSAYWDRLVLATEECGGETKVPIDGVASYKSALERCRRAHAASKGLGLSHESNSLEEKILVFLYVRDGIEILPVCDKNSHTLYRYPQFELLSSEPESVGDCLTGLFRRTLIEPVTLIDRTRHCRACGSVHLHYVDVCPICASIQIKSTPSFHCFACGAVLPEQEFISEDGIACPRCLTRLRHIGVDYDRPMTNYSCGNCHSIFVDSAVSVRCLDCGASSTPDELDVQEVCSLRLSSRGRAALKAGNVSEDALLLGVRNFVEPKFFRRTLDRTLALTKRHEEVKFGLVLLEFRNLEELGREYGADFVYTMLDEFARRMHEYLRAYDVTTRTQENRLWVYLPLSSPRGLAHRLRNIIDEQHASDASRTMDVRIRTLEAPQDVGAEDNAESLMSRLLGE
ncbi:MAG: diguanylate cyclase [Zoogloea sp.]|nr:diguanylate cyclase [Zoogloea sp.]